MGWQKRRVFSLHSISKLTDEKSFDKWEKKEECFDNCCFLFRKENQNFVEYMKVFDDPTAEFDAEKVANLIQKKWGNKTT